MRVAVVAHGMVDQDSWTQERLDDAELIVAADGGAAAVWSLGRCPSVVVGDLDSLDARLRAAMEAAGCEFRTHPPEKDQTDLELALLLARQRGASNIDVLGALGGERFDHALANVLALALPELAGLPVALVDRRHEVRLLRGPGQAVLAGRPGDIVTLLPLTAAATAIDTTGLLYPLHDGTLHLGRSRGVSNELTREVATVRLGAGLLLVILHRQTRPPP